MEREHINVLLASNANKFKLADILSVKSALENMSDEKVLVVSTVNYRDPTLMLLIAILFGFDRFFLGQVGLGLVKVFTFYGFFIWWLVDIFSVVKRAKAYNYTKFMAMAAKAWCCPAEIVFNIYSCRKYLLSDN